MIDSTTAGDSSYDSAMLSHIADIHLAIYALVFAYYDAGRVDIEQHMVFVSGVHLTHHMLLYRSIDIGVSIVSMVN